MERSMKTIHLLLEIPEQFSELLTGLVSDGHQFPFLGLELLALLLGQALLGLLAGLLLTEGRQYQLNITQLRGEFSS